MSDADNRCARCGWIRHPLALLKKPGAETRCVDPVYCEQLKRLDDPRAVEAVKLLENP